MTDTSLLEENGFGCKLLAVLERISINAMYACMMVDGFFLHKLIVRVFSPEPNILILYGVVAGNFVQEWDKNYSHSGILKDNIGILSGVVQE